jgi:cysteine desulfurase/selenocysteine lyase
MTSQPVKTGLDIEQIRQDFPILRREVRPGIPLVYLDSTATTQKPIQVIEVIEDYYRTYNANVHRGVHTLAEEATAAYEAARQRSADFIHAHSAKEIIFTHEYD